MDVNENTNVCQNLHFLYTRKLFDYGVIKVFCRSK